MSDFRVLFVCLNLPGIYMLPTAIGLLTSLLRREGIIVELFDTTHYALNEGFDNDREKEKNLSVRPFEMGERKLMMRQTDPFDDFDKKVNSFKPDLIAMSSVEDLFPLGLELLNRIRYTGVKTLVGGVFSTFAPELVIAHDAVDMICVGEGEAALPELCRRMKDGKDYSDIGNLWVKTQSRGIVKNPLLEVSDINKNPPPDFSLFDETRFYKPLLGKVYKMFPVETMRGCPYSCTYCDAPAQRKLYRLAHAGSFFRKKSADRVRLELEHYRTRYGAEFFYFWADTFLACSDREFDEFVEMYSNIKIPFFMQTRPETVTEDKIRRLTAIGLHRMSLGVEHGNEAFRKTVLKRTVTNREIMKALDIIASCGVPGGVSVNNIVGLPTETVELAFDTIELNRRFRDKVDTMNIYAFTPYHGAELRALTLKLGYIEETDRPKLITAGSMLNMPQFPRERIEGIMKTFNMYVRFEKSRWKDIELAEKNTPEGNAMFETLRKEFVARFFNS